MLLSDFFESMKGATPVEKPIVPAAPQIPDANSQVSGYLRTTLPLPLQYSPDTLKQYNRPGLSSFRIAPLPPGGNPAVNSASSSIINSQIEQFVNIAAAGPNGAVQFNNGGPLGGAANFTWNNSSSTLTINGSLVLTTPLAVTYGGTGSNLSATGGAHQVVQQSTLGGVFTVGQLAFTDISGVITTAQEPSTTVNFVVNDTNVTGSISAQTLTLGWTGTLAIARGGTGTSSPALVAGPDITITGSWPNNTIAVSTQGGVTAGSYTTTNLTVDAQGIITAISNGTAGPTITSINRTAQTANIAATNIVSSASAGTYLITVYLVVSQAASSSSTLPDSRLIYTDQDSGATITVPVTSGLTTNTLSTFAQASFIVNAKATTALQFDVGQVTPYASVGGTVMQFAYHARAVFLN